MNFVQRLKNPVLINEWKVRMRTNRTAWMIMLYLVVLGGLALTFIYLRTDFNNNYDPDATSEIFVFLAVLQLAMICMFTPGLTAGAISGERERQTLYVLMTTNLTATKLILGKWLSSLSFMMFLVLASIPLYGIVFLYGGISPKQLIEVFGLYIISMLALGSLGVLCSTIFKRTGISIVVTYALLFGYTAGTFFMYVVLKEWLDYQRSIANTVSAAAQTPSIWPDVINCLNPLVAILNLFDFGILDTYDRNGSPNGNSLWPMDPYWIYILFLALVTVVALLLAIYLIKPVRPRLRKRK